MKIIAGAGKEAFEQLALGVPGQVGSCNIRSLLWLESFQGLVAFFFFFLKREHKEKLQTSPNLK